VNYELQTANLEMPSPDESIELLKLGGSQIINEPDLKKKLQEGRSLRVKFGVDPTSPDLHLGHSVNLFKLRQFQDLGHLAVLIIGDFTSMVGDPTGRSSTRPMLSYEQVIENAETYKKQAFKVLSSDRIEIVFNSDWFKKMTFMEIIKLNSRVTLQQMLQREDFKARIDEAQPIFLHELQYPIMQGWDSVMVRSDVELGGTDQLFNILVGRDLQKEEGQPQQVACIQPILEGLDGVQKMSKSLGNYVGVTESPVEMFGKLMSVFTRFCCRKKHLISIQWRRKSSLLHGLSRVFMIGPQRKRLKEILRFALRSAIWMRLNFRRCR
jgi:tyrosyl-tRNA synthetase